MHIPLQSSTDNTEKNVFAFPHVAMEENLYQDWAEAR